MVSNFLVCSTNRLVSVIKRGNSLSNLFNASLQFSQNARHWLHFLLNSLA